jgi:hypothetical protein
VKRKPPAEDALSVPERAVRATFAETPASGGTWILATSE